LFSLKKGKWIAAFLSLKIAAIHLRFFLVVSISYVEFFVVREVFKNRCFDDE